MAVFGTDVRLVSMGQIYHIKAHKNIFDEGELVRASTVAKFATVQNEGNRQVERAINITILMLSSPWVIV